MEIINAQKLNELYGSEQTALEILKMFSERSHILIEEISVALDEKDTAMLSRICHKGVGQARYIAAPILEETLRKIEAAHWPEKHQHLISLKAIISDINNAYQ